MTWWWMHVAPKDFVWSKFQLFGFEPLLTVLRLTYVFARNEIEKCPKFANMRSAARIFNPHRNERTQSTIVHTEDSLEFFFIYIFTIPFVFYPRNEPGTPCKWLYVPHCFPCRWRTGNCRIAPSCRPQWPAIWDIELVTECRIYKYIQVIRNIYEHSNM